MIWWRERVEKAFAAWNEHPFIPGLYRMDRAMKASGIREVIKENGDLRRLLREAFEVEHSYSGGCPDEVEGRNSRDPECPACRWLIQAEEVLSRD